MNVGYFSYVYINKWDKSETMKKHTKTFHDCQLQTPLLNWIIDFEYQRKISSISLCFPAIIVIMYTIMFHFMDIIGINKLKSIGDFKMY